MHSTSRSHTRFYMPPPALASYIERIYVHRAEPYDEEKLSLMLPAGTGLEFVYHLNNPYSVQGNTLPNMHTLCQRKAAVAELNGFCQAEPLHFISVRFRSGRFRHFTNTPFSKLNNQYLASESLWDSDDVAALSQVQDIPEVDDKVAWLYDFFATMLDKYFYAQYSAQKQRRLAEWDSVIDEIYYHADSVKLHDLFEKYGMSQRQFERGFKAEFCVTAKHFQKLARLQSVLKQTLRAHADNYYPNALNNGYFDQSHFIKDFKSAIGMRPKDFFVSENFQNHFYFSSVRPC